MIFSLEWQRKRALKKVTNKPAHKYLSVPLPDKKTPLKEVEYLALDFETTGLDPHKEKILSIGYTVLRDWKIVLGKSGHYIINVGIPLPESSVVIHQITDSDARAGYRFKKTMKKLLKEMRGRVLLVHFAPVERGFLNAATKALYGHTLPFRLVDTMQLAEQRLKMANPYITPNDLRLFNLREAHGLPRYNAHSALEDAIATAELFLALMAPPLVNSPRMTLDQILS
jgi:DNA polymerase-3 subunit epsilon